MFSEFLRWNTAKRRPGPGATARALLTPFWGSSSVRHVGKQSTGPKILGICSDRQNRISAETDAKIRCVRDVRLPSPGRLRFSEFGLWFELKRCPQAARIRLAF